MSHGLPTKTQPLIDLAKLFLKLGATAFGGPAAHIAMMEDEVVRRRRWRSVGNYGQSETHGKTLFHSQETAA